MQVKVTRIFKEIGYFLIFITILTVVVLGIGRWTTHHTIEQMHEEDREGWDNLYALWGESVEQRSRMSRRKQEFANFKCIYTPLEAHIMVHDLEGEQPADSTPWVVKGKRQGMPRWSCAVDQYTIKRMKLQCGDNLAYGKRMWTINGILDDFYGRNGQVYIELAVRPEDGFADGYGRVIFITENPRCYQPGK